MRLDDPAPHRVGNHPLAAARVARERITGERVVGGHEACLYEGRRGGDEARGVAARVGDALARGDGGALALRELGEAVGPVGGRAVRRGGVDDAGVGVLHETHGLAGRVVGQAEEHDVSGVDEALALVEVVALVLVDAQQLQVVARADAVEDLQAGRAALAIDVYLGPCHGVSFVQRRPGMRGAARTVVVVRTMVAQAGGLRDLLRELTHARLMSHPRVSGLAAMADA